VAPVAPVPPLDQVIDRSLSEHATGAWPFAHASAGVVAMIRTLPR
jgi:hypothetical protein